MNIMKHLAPVAGAVAAVFALNTQSLAQQQAQGTGAVSSVPDCECYEKFQAGVQKMEILHQNVRDTFGDATKITPSQVDSLNKVEKQIYTDLQDQYGANEDCTVAVLCDYRSKNANDPNMVYRMEIMKTVLIWKKMHVYATGPAGLNDRIGKDGEKRPDFPSPCF